MPRILSPEELGRLLEAAPGPGLKYKAGTGNAFALVLPEVSTTAMQIFLDAFSKTIAAGEHVLMFLDHAGWHVANALKVPDNMTLESLPPYSPELNPVERIYLYLKERFLSHRLHDDHPAIVDAICDAWNRLVAMPGRLSTLTNFGWRENQPEKVVG